MLWRRRIFYFMKPKIKNGSLYLLVSAKYGRGRSPAEITKAAIAGGVDMIQMREKDRLSSELLDEASAIRAICRKNKITFVVNDDPMLAKKVDADGVHLGQGDAKLYTVNEARAILGKDKLIGLSTGSIEEVRLASNEDIDYIGFGPVFPTKEKIGCVGTGDIEKVLAIAKKPVFFIGGINISNIDELVTKGAKNIAVIRAILESEDITSAARVLKDKFKRISA